MKSYKNYRELVEFKNDIQNKIYGGINIDGKNNSRADKRSKERIQ